MGRDYCLAEAEFASRLSEWAPYLGDAGRVVVVRDPHACIRGVLEEVQRDPLVPNDTLSAPAAEELWASAYRVLLEQSSDGAPWIFVHVDDVRRGAAVPRLEAFCGASLSLDCVEPALLRPSLAAGVLKESTRELYAELCERARASRSSLPARAERVAAVLAVRESGRDRLADAIDDLRAQRGVDVEIFVFDATARGLDGIPGARVLRQPCPSEARMIERVLDVSDAEFVAWCGLEARALPHRIASAVRLLESSPNAQLAVGAVGLADERGSVLRTLHVRDEADAGWAHASETVVARRGALESLLGETFVPAVRDRLRRAAEAGEVVCSRQAVAWVTPAGHERATQRAEAEDAWLESRSLAAAPEPRVSVLLASHNRWDALLDCLQGFALQALAPGSLELIVVDDGSTDGTPRWAAGLALPVPFVFREQANQGACAARNNGLADVRGEYVLFVNDDTVPFPGTVQAHLDAHRDLQDPKSVVLGTFEQPEEALGNALMRVLESSELVFQYADLRPGQELGGAWFYTCNVSLRAAAIVEIGSFDTSFPCYAEGHGLRAAARDARATVCSSVPKREPCTNTR